MKKIIITILLLAGSFCIASAQSAKMNPDSSITYLTNIFKKGQDVQLSYGSGSNKEFEFVNIKNTHTFKNEKPSSDYSKKVIKLNKLYFVGNKAFIRGRNDDDSDVVIDVEGAIDNKELVAPNNVIVAAPLPDKKVVKKKN